MTRKKPTVDNAVHTENDLVVSGEDLTLIDINPVRPFGNELAPINPVAYGSDDYAPIVNPTEVKALVARVTILEEAAQHDRQVIELLERLLLQRIEALEAAALVPAAVVELAAAPVDETELIIQLTSRVTTVEQHLRDLNNTVEAY
jgi:hypothetical protein